MPAGAPGLRKDQSENVGVKYFYREKRKSEPDYRAANKRAYQAAVENSLRWASQFAQEKGYAPARYAQMSMRLQALLNEGQPLPLTPTEHKAAAEKAAGERKARRQFESSRRNWGVSRGGGGGDELEIDERKAGEPTPHEHTNELRAQKQRIDEAVAVATANVQSGRNITPVAGIKKKKEKGWFERNIGAKIGGAYHELAESPVGDVTGWSVDKLNRLGSGVAGAIQSGIEQGVQTSADPLSGAQPTPDPREDKDFEKKTAQQKQMAVEAYERNRALAEEGPVSAFTRGVTGHNKDSSFINYYTNKQIARTGRAPTTAERVLMGVGGLGADIATDPMNFVSIGTAKKGIQVARQARNVRGAEDVIIGAKEAAQVHDIVDEVENLRTAWKAPLELPEVSESTRAARAFDITDEAKSTVRRFEVAAEASKAQKIRDATDEGFKALKTATKKAARTGAPEHAALLRRVREAEEFRTAAANIPVGGKLSLLEKRASRLARLSSEMPEDAILARKARRARQVVEQARVAAIPENAERLFEVTKKLASGKKITSAELKAIVEAEPAVQDKILGLAQSAEAMPGKQVGKAAGIKATNITGEAGLPNSTRIMQAMEEASQEALKTAPSEATVAEAASQLGEGVGSEMARKRAEMIIRQAEEMNQKLSPASIKGIVAREVAGMSGEEAVRGRAAVSAGQKLAEAKRAEGPLISSARREAMFQEALMEEILPTAQAMERYLNEAIGRRVAIRIAGKDLGEFQPIGRILSGAQVPFELVGKVGHRLTGGKFGKAFRIGAHFEGETNYIRQMAENSGTVAHKEFAARIAAEITNKVSPEESRMIARAIESGKPLGDPRLEEIRQLAITESRRIFDEQVKIGKYMPVEHSPDYVYHYYHSKNKKAVTAYKKARTSEIKAGGKGARLQDAAKHGLKPEERIDKILLMQHRDYVRDLQRSAYRHSVLSQYGVLADNAEFARQIGLEEASMKMLPKKFVDDAKMKKSKWYLPPEIHETFKTMDNLLQIGYNGDAEGFLNAYDALVRGYKTSTTVANIGNWVNNTVGDFFLNWVDGVYSPAWYGRSRKLLMAGGADSYVSVGGQSVKGSAILERFYAKAPTGGLLRSEGASGLHGRSGIRGLIPRGARKIQSAYETREDWVRLAHFLHAVDDEIGRFTSRGMSAEKALDAATDLAAKRVSKWNIDYTGLTPFERQLRRRFIPFYTWTRKATPLMLEAMILRPGKINQFAKSKTAIEKMLGVPNPEDDGTVWPDWAMQQGITRLTGGNEPFYIRDPTPLGVINRTWAGDTQRAPLTNVMNMAAPPIKMGLELAQGKTLYNDRPINNWGEWLLGQVPPVSMAMRAAGYPLSAQNPVGQNPSTAGTSIAERLSTFGAPIGKMSEVRQQAALHGQINENDDIFKRMRAAIEPYGYKITTTNPKKGEKYYVVKKDGELVGRYRDFNQAFLDIQDSLAGRI